VAPAAIRIDLGRAALASKSAQLSSRRAALLEWGHLSATTIRGSTVRLRLFAPTRVWKWSLPLVAAALVTPVQATAPAQAPQNKKPSINIRTNPRSGFSPLRVVLTAELTGGADDFEDFYCASVEWDWGDGTKSESKSDCDPYEAGKSEIKRRYAQEHTFRANNSTTSSATGFSGAAGDISQNQPPIQFRVRFLLKQKNKTVGSGQATIEVRPGLGDGL
jgi:hypothetical protein